MDRIVERAVVSLTLDRSSADIVVTCSDGAEFRLGQQAFPPAGVLSRVCLLPAQGALSALTCDGEEILYEMPRADDADRLGGRLIVYLDQNQWSTVSKALTDPSRCSADDVTAAGKLARLVQQRRIVLPASAAHFFETTKWTVDAKRYRLGLTVLQLSRGWQMRDPLRVRRDEFHACLSRHLARPTRTRDTDAFTLEPYAMHAERAIAPLTAPETMPREIALPYTAACVAMTFIETMLDAQPCPPPPPTTWAAAQQEFSDWLHQQGFGPEKRRKAVDATVFADLTRDIAQEAHAIGMPPDSFQDWLIRDPMSQLAELPAVGVYREMLQDRHGNRGTTWQTNDLTDMVYLSCAAGYADIVVCERHMASTLKQGLRRRDRRTRVVTRLRDAVAAIESASGTERADDTE